MNDLTNTQVQRTVQNGIGNLRTTLARLSGDVDSVQRNSQHIDDVLRSVQSLQKSLNNLASRINNAQLVSDQQQLIDMHKQLADIDTRLEKMESFCDSLYEYMQHQQLAQSRSQLADDNFN